MTSINHPLSWLGDELAALDSAGIRRRRKTISALPDGWCEVEGRRVRNFASNDYLNLAHDPRVVAAAHAGLSGGVGATGSALVCGRTVWHDRLEQSLATFEHTESALLFPTGYAANVGTLSALIDAGDLIFCDRFNHASLIDGCRLSRGRLRLFRHSDLDRLRAELEKAPASIRKWIVSDTVFSMDGELAPLPELCHLTEQYGAALVVDEAHATGVFGDQGRGMAEATGTENRIAVRIGTLSKAIGAVGGFVAGSAEVIDWLWNSARTQMYSTALPPAVCAAAIQAIELIRSEPWRRTQLHQRCEQFRVELRTRGVSALPSSVGPIVPILLRTPERAVEAAAKLLERGYLVAAIRPPTVPHGTSRLRVSLTAAFSELEIIELAQAISCVLDSLP